MRLLPNHCTIGSAGASPSQSFQWNRLCKDVYSGGLALPLMTTPLPKVSSETRQEFRLCLSIAESLDDFRYPRTDRLEAYPTLGRTAGATFFFILPAIGCTAIAFAGGGKNSSTDSPWLMSLAGHRDANSQTIPHLLDRRNGGGSNRGLAGATGQI